MRPEKQLLLDEIKDKMTASKALLFARYEKLEPNLASVFRTDIAKSGGNLEVVRKRILIKAAESYGIKLDPEMLAGHIAVVFADADPVQTTKVVFQFCKDNEDMLHVIGGQFEGKLCSAQDVKQISELPSKDEMRAQFLGLLEAPMGQVLSVFEALLTSVAYCLENKSKESI